MKEMIINHMCQFLRLSTHIFPNLDKLIKYSSTHHRFGKMYLTSCKVVCKKTYKNMAPFLLYTSRHLSYLAKIMLKIACLPFFNSFCASWLSEDMLQKISVRGKISIY